MLKGKKVLIIVISVIVLVAIVIGFFICFNHKKVDYEKMLKGYMEDMAREFYEELYYPKLENGDEEARNELLSKFEEIGFKITLESLTRYKTEDNKDKINSFVNPDTGKECDLKSSIISIFPKSPFGINDYEIKVELVCGFETN